jgi:hypothetical protein
MGLEQKNEERIGTTRKRLCCFNWSFPPHSHTHSLTHSPSFLLLADSTDWSHYLLLLDNIFTMQLNETKSFSAWGTDAEVDIDASMKALALSAVSLSLPQLTVGGKKMTLDEVTKVAFFKVMVTLDPTTLQSVGDKMSKSSPSVVELEPAVSAASSTLPREACRAAVLQLIIFWMQGRSGVRTTAIEYLADMLNSDQVPVFTTLANAPVELVRASKFAFNDTERHAIFQGEFVFTGMAGLVGGFAQKTFRILDVVASFSCEAASVNLGESVDPAVYELLRPQRGQMSSATNLKLMLDSSRNNSAAAGDHDNVFKSIPQIHGPAFEASASSSR